MIVGVVETDEISRDNRILWRSPNLGDRAGIGNAGGVDLGERRGDGGQARWGQRGGFENRGMPRFVLELSGAVKSGLPCNHAIPQCNVAFDRSEERRVGKE